MNDDRSDQQLVEATRAGDTSAFASLFRRHFTLGRCVVSRTTSDADVDDIVQEAFASIYEAILRGSGPRFGFVPYFRATLRNTAILMTNRNRKEVAVEDIDLALQSREDVASPPGGDADYLSASAKAFQTLPERWQTVLFFTVVEGMKPSDAAPLLGLTTTAATQLAYRAREGLRQAWLADIVKPVDPSDECRWSVAQLGGYARKRNSSRAHVRFQRHLGVCASCSSAADDALQLANTMQAEYA
jgi:RNA polymerase sigma factor (sigma-70 family)